MRELVVQYDVEDRGAREEGERYEDISARSRFRSVGPEGRVVSVPREIGHEGGRSRLR